MRFHAHPRGAVVWTGFAQPPFDKQDFEAEMAESGLQAKIQGELASFRESPAVRRVAFEAGLKAIERRRAEGKHVLAVLLSTQGFEQDIEAALPRLMAAGEGSVTPIVVTPFREEQGPWQSLKPPFTAQWTLERARAEKRLYPALLPAMSMSSTAVSARHEALRERVVAILNACQETDPTHARFDLATSGYDKDAEPGHRLMRYFSQSFQIATPFGGMPGEYTPLECVLDEIELVLEPAK